MALNSAIQWEVRTTGDAMNGAGFKAGASGTDWSQQDAAQYSFTDAVVNTNSTLVMSVATTFGTDVVGNVICISGGTGNIAKAYYEITSRSSSTTVIVDRNIVGVSSSGCTVKIGGAALTIASVAAVCVAGNTVYVAGGTYAEEITHAVWGPCYYIGYVSGSARVTAFGTDRPLIDGGSSRANCFTFSAGKNYIKNFRFANSTSHGFTNSSSGNCYVVNCKSSSNGGSGFYRSGGDTRYINCEANSNTTLGFNGGSDVKFCYSHDNTTYGIASNSGQIINCVVESNSNSGLLLYQEVLVIGCVVYNNAGASVDGCSIQTDSNYGYQIFNSSFVNNGRYGVNRVSTAGFIEMDYNSFYGNGTAAYTGGIVAGAHDVTSSPNFTDAANGDFTLQSGSPLIGAGYPNAATNGLVGDYQMNIGLDQDDNVAAGTGGTTTIIGSAWLPGE